MSLGSNIRKIRESKNISLDEMVKKLSIFKQTYINIEKDLIRPSSNILAKISNIFNLNQQDIINYKEDIINQQISELNLKNLKDIISSAKEKEKIEKSIITPITKTNINVVLEDLSIKEILYKKPILLKSSELFQIGDRIKTVEVKDSFPTDIYIDKFGDLSKTSEKTISFSSKILNWTEPFLIKGVEKTLLFTEINTGLQVGDRVFIVNGNYDSNLFIKENRYKRKTDGYKVLFVDKCRIVLDIDYDDNILPFIEEPIDNFINIYLIQNNSDFLQVNRQLTTKGGEVDFKFSKNKNNIVFFDKPFDSITLDWGTSSGIIQRGFYVKDDGNWIDISDDITSGSFSVALSEDYPNNGKVRINNGSFTFSVSNRVVSFNEGLVYEWKTINELDGYPEYESWVVNTKYNVPFITKSNFRKGDFKGTFNSGVFGTQENQITWNGSHFNSTWNTGVLLNTNWVSGKMNSKNKLTESYISEFDGSNTPYQKVTAPNNNGVGYNYVEKSKILDIDVENGFFNDTLIGESPTYSIMEDYINATSSSYSFTVNKAVINKCRINGGLIKNSDVINSRFIDSRLENVKSVNSNYKLSVITDSIYMSDDIIKIISYDEFTIAEKNNGLDSHKMYKFYISEKDYKSLKIRDRFYLKGINIKDGLKYPLNFFDRRFRISSWTEYFDSWKNDKFIKRGVEVGAFLSTPADNEFKLNYILSPTKTVIIKNNENKGYSIDIVVSTYDIEDDEFENDNITNQLSINGLSINNKIEPSILQGLTYSEPSKLGDNIDISNAYIINSDFESGIMENTDWISGNNINYNNDVNIVTDSDFGTYSISITQSSKLIVNTGYNSLYSEIGDYCLDVGNIVFLDNIDYQSPYNNIIKLSDTYKIIEKEDNQLILEEIGTNIITSITESGGTFLTKDAQNRYNYIKKSKISKSKILSGIFRRSYIKDSFIDNPNYSVSDLDFNNINKIKELVISDCIFKDNSNIFSKALYMNSSFVSGDDKFENGIVYNSIWNGLDFNKGLFKESRWVNGVFNGGTFYNNRSFDGVTSSNTPFFNDERVKSYYKDGIVSATQSNNRYSWQNGEFNSEFINTLRMEKIAGSEFFESDWENGDFNSGKFYYSKFYNGNINGGLIGDIKVPITNTLVYNANINFTTVNNATIIASDNFSGTSSQIIWHDGIFNSGEFGSRDNNVAIWKNGTFNGGNFENLAIWENGRFNGGKFLSTFGWTMSDSTDQLDYTWQDGVFNGGEFGSANGASNSTWFTGEFNGGKFLGRVWNNGIFTNGDFIGSATYSAIRGVTSTQSNALFFTDSFTSSYYGLWRDGVVSDKKDEFIKDRPVLTAISRVKERKKELSASIINSLWINGTFSHSSGVVENSVWLNGVFEKGVFFKSSFNPYVFREGLTQSSFELSDSCSWENGELIDSDFYISKWKRGTFNTGDAYGMIWEDGVCKYMNAFNIFWEKGIWKNGNWYGSFINYNGTIEDDFYKQILLRGASWSGTQSMHVWNIFEDKDIVSDFSSASASNITTFFNPFVAEST